MKVAEDMKASLFKVTSKTNKNVNYSSRCKVWASRGKCNSEPKYMLSNCWKSCKGDKSNPGACKIWNKKYNVVSETSWGTLPMRFQKNWTRWGCTKLLEKSYFKKEKANGLKMTKAKNAAAASLKKAAAKVAREASAKKASLKNAAAKIAAAAAAKKVAAAAAAAAKKANAKKPRAIMAKLANMVKKAPKNTAAASLQKATAKVAAKAKKAIKQAAAAAYLGNANTDTKNKKKANMPFNGTVIKAKAKK